MPYPRGPQPRYVNIAIVRGGQPYTGRCTVAKGLVTVTGIGGTKTAQLGDSKPTALAERLLSEIVADHEAKMNRKP
jgi:hypothetical protein